MKVLCNFLVVFSMILATGCGGSGSNPKPVPMETSGPADLKVRLQIFADTGMVGSAIAGMKEAIQKLPADKSGPLLEDFDKLNDAATPAKVKEIAKRMIEKL